MAFNSTVCVCVASDKCIPIGIAPVALPVRYTTVDTSIIHQALKRDGAVRLNLTLNSLTSNISNSIGIRRTTKHSSPSPLFSSSLKRNYNILRTCFAALYIFKSPPLLPTAILFWTRGLYLF